jgi:Flp pilus assembly protein TadD
MVYCTRIGILAAGALVCASCTHEVLPASRGITAPEVQTRHVQNAADAGDGDLEARALRQRLAANAQDLDARMSLALRYSQRGFPDLALEHYRFAAVQFPDSIPVTLALGKMLRQMGQTEQALAAVQAGLARHPGGNWELFSLEGILEDDRREFQAAEQAHRAALALNPKQATLYNNLGYNLLLQGKPEAAAAEFHRSLEMDPRSQIAHNNLAAALAAESRYQEALQEWQRVADPAVAHNNLATTLIEQGRYAEARTELEYALAIRRNFPAAAANLRLVAAKDGRPATVPSKRQQKQERGVLSHNQEGISTSAPTRVDAGN